MSTQFLEAALYAIINDNKLWVSFHGVPNGMSYWTVSAPPHTIALTIIEEHLDIAILKVMQLLGNKP